MGGTLRGGGDKRNPALTAHLFPEPVPEDGHTGVDPWLPWLPASVPPGGDSIQDLSGAGVRLRTGEGASRVTLWAPDPREGALHRPLAPTPRVSLTAAGLGSSELYWGYHACTHFSQEDMEAQRNQ